MTLTARSTLFGRYAAPDPPSETASLHFHDGVTKLTTVDHEPKVGVLDQEDLLEQGIYVSQFIPNAQNVDALGSCTANTNTESASNILTQTQFVQYVTDLGKEAPAADPYADVVAAERAAIGFYHACTDQTGQSAEEWPPTDCGSSGPFMYACMKSLGYITGQRIAAHGAENLASLLQPGGACWGTTWFNAWMEPDAQAFIDGNGSVEALKRAIASGVAGGHEIYLSAIEKIAFLATGQVDPHRTVLRFRNHWTKSWGDNGSGRVHLSTLVNLGSNIDVRAFIPAN